MERRGQASYVIQWAPGETLAVHADQLKPWVGEDELGLGVPLFHTQSDPPQKWPMGIHRVVDHRETHKGLQFLVQWEGAPPQMDTWIDMEEFLEVVPGPWKEYCRQRQLRIEVQ